MSTKELAILLNNTKRYVKAGKLNRQAAERITTPLINKVNAKRKELSNRFNVEIPNLTFEQFMKM